ncbi:MAG: bifunctional adenosylcobinamide kinase/adenosylcobinamide-phosphate guanylyltransferase [Chloroflexi bacterium]|nr:bifunctional adenosylcobinamide kinase/adenosylcobinamide-phosphate guanylyltransferase [Chloroflexota bacterium]MYD47928.1 bifunctional adenosylcobinamide kinase/adenosylcobinamide-phosphate guanylyltransferase [Chloroflexota bacterium]
MSTIHLVLGGIRSGKSAHAEKLTAQLASSIGNPVLYLATGLAVDAEMSERIRRHQERRPAEWQTVEAPLNPVGALQGLPLDASRPPVLLLDSLDGWVSNLLFEHENAPPPELEARVVGAVRRFASFVAELDADTVIVSSEVGHSLVATSPLGRQFQDLLGTVNQTIAADAEAVTLVVAGISVPIKAPSLDGKGLGEGGPLA